MARAHLLVTGTSSIRPNGIYILWYPHRLLRHCQKSYYIYSTVHTGGISMCSSWQLQAQCQLLSPTTVLAWGSSKFETHPKPLCRGQVVVRRRGGTSNQTFKLDFGAFRS